MELKMSDGAIYSLIGAVAVAVWYAYTKLKYDSPTKIRGKTVSMAHAGLDYPGHMAFANKGGEYFHGCRAAHFRNVRELNEFFLPGNAGALKLVADIQIQPDGSVLLIYTNALTPEDMAAVEDFNREQHAFLQQKRIERQAAKEEELKEKAKEEQEQKRLAEVGRKYEARVGKLRSLPADSQERKEGTRALNSGDLGEDPNGGEDTTKDSTR